MMGVLYWSMTALYACGLSRTSEVSRICTSRKKEDRDTGDAVKQPPHAFPPAVQRSSRHPGS
jgi:hypothetical protein